MLFSFRFPAVAIRRRHQFLFFGNRNGASEVGIYIFNVASEPDIEIVGQIGVTDIVVVWRIGRDDCPIRQTDILRIVLNLSAGSVWPQTRKGLPDPINGTEVISRAIAEDVAFSEIPSHRDGLSSKGEADKLR